MVKKITKDRLVTFDLLRGFFILVIIIDHLQRWPGIFDWFTGQGRLWASAAEGFILISGIMIGLIRGYKSKNVSFGTVTKKVLSRAFTLYVWAVLTCLISLVLVKFLPIPIIPFPPGLDSFDVGSPFYLLWQILTLQATFGWSVFLILYAVFLAITPAAIWLLRNNKWWLLLTLSICVWIIGLGKNQNLLSWQLLFFGGAIFGYYYYPLREKWHSLKNQKMIKGIIVSAAGVTLVASVFTIFAWPIVKSSWSPISYPDFLLFRTQIDPFFIRNELRPAHIAISLLWFSALFIIFNRYKHLLQTKLGWLLIPFGRHSLFAYIIQGFIVIIVGALIPQTTNMFINALIIAVSVYVVLLLTTKVPWLHKIIPS
jgi:hypothetical protein